jgi:hypothetical protein
MRELNVMEVEAVSGAGFLSSLSSAILAGTVFAAGGTYIGGVGGGSGGGFLGFGLLGEAVGAIAGGILGAATGVVMGAALGWDNPESINSLSTQVITSIINGNFAVSA